MARNGNGKYQLLRPEEYQALRDDIAKRGVLVPVEVDKDSGAILDGHHRSEIAPSVFASSTLEAVEDLLIKFYPHYAMERVSPEEGGRSVITGRVVLNMQQISSGKCYCTTGNGGKISLRVGGVQCRFKACIPSSINSWSYRQCPRSSSVNITYPD